MSLESLYQELILDHSKRPKGKGIAEATERSAISHQRNPICGDEVTLRVRVSDDGHQGEALEHPLTMLLKEGLLFSRKLVQMVVDTLDTVVLKQEFDGRLGSNAGDARDVV